MAFDHKTHTRDPKSGRVVGKNPYRKVISQVNGSSVELNERPVGSGIWYNADGSLNEEKSKEGLAKQAAEEKAEQDRIRLANMTPAEREELEYKKAQELIAKRNASKPVESKSAELPKGGK